MKLRFMYLWLITVKLKINLGLLVNMFYIILKIVSQKSTFRKIFRFIHTFANLRNPNVTDGSQLPPAELLLEIKVSKH